MNPQQLYSRFIILRSLLGNGQRVFRRTLLFFVGLYCVGLALTAIDGSLYLADAKIGYVEDPANYFFFVSFFLSTFFVYKLLLEFIVAFNGQLGDFSKDGGLLLTIRFDEAYEQELRTSISRKQDAICCKDRRTYRALQVVLITLVTVFGVWLPLKSGGMSGNWNFSYDINQPFFGTGQHFLGYFYNQAKDIIVFGFLVPPLLWLAVTVARSTISLVREIQAAGRLEITPYAADGVGGLRSLGNISLYLFYIAVSPLFHLLTASFVLGFPKLHQFLYLPYFVFMVTVFFLPLGAVRTTMKKAKQAELSFLSILMRKFIGSVRPGAATPKEISQFKKGIDQIQALCAQVRGLPIWPFDFRTFARFITGVLVPVLVFVFQTLPMKDSLITIVIDWLTKVIWGRGA